MNNNLKLWTKGLVRFIELLETEKLHSVTDSDINIFPQGMNTFDDWLSFCEGVIEIDKTQKYWKLIIPPNSFIEILLKEYQEHVTVEHSNTKGVISSLGLSTRIGLFKMEDFLLGVTTRFQKVGSYDSGELNRVFRFLFELYAIASEEVSDLFKKLGHKNGKIYELLGTYMNIPEKDLDEDDIFTLAIGLYIITAFDDDFKSTSDIQQEFQFINNILNEPSHYKNIVAQYIKILKVFNRYDLFLRLYKSSESSFDQWIDGCFINMEKLDFVETMHYLNSYPEIISEAQWDKHLLTEDMIIQYFLNAEPNILLGSNYRKSLFTHASQLSSNALKKYPKNWYKLATYLNREDKNIFLNDLFALIKQKIVSEGNIFRICRVYGQIFVADEYLLNHPKEFLDIASKIIRKNQGEELEWTQDIILKYPDIYSDAPSRTRASFHKILKELLSRNQLPTHRANVTGGVEYWPESRRREMMENIAKSLRTH